ncbi:MAG: Hpt domain-containing protein [Planctomycetaceae bacterium]|nr:Hpt domain-containing protein [Planctomycetaceae bacterium]
MPDNSVFDMNQLLESTCDDRELAAQVVGVFLNDIPKQLADLDAAIAAADVKTAERVAHSIKGAAATVGGESLRATALDCEQLAREGDLDGVQSHIPDLKSHYDLLKNALLEAGFIAE